MKKPFKESKEALILVIALSAMSVGSFILLVALLLVTPLVLIVEARQSLMQLFRSQNQTT